MVRILNDSATLGMGWATGRLSSLLGTRVAQAGVEFQVVPSGDLVNHLGDEVVTTRMSVGEPLRVTIVMVLPRWDSELIFRMVTGERADPASPDFLPVIAEVGNICICGYIAALADLVRVRLFPTPPEARWGAFPLEAYAHFPEVLLIKAAFQARGTTFGGFIFLIPDPSGEPSFLKFLSESTRVITKEVAA